MKLRKKDLWIAAGLVAGYVIWKKMRKRRIVGVRCCNDCKNPECIPLRQCTGTYVCEGCDCALQIKM